MSSIPGAPPGPIGPTGPTSVAPKAWAGWRSIQGSVNVSLRTSVRNAAVLNTGTAHGLGRMGGRRAAGGRPPGLQGPVG